MKSISLCMIVRDEEEVLERCLHSAEEIADEIIIVDTGSTDKTKQIASKYTDKVYDFLWTDDFSAARNFSFSKAGCEYIMWLDADDVLSPGAAARIKSLKNSSDMNADVYMMKYDVAFDEGGRPVFSYYRERILKRSRRAEWVGKVHEAVAPYGKTEYIEEAVEHRKVKVNDPDRNLRIFEKMISDGCVLDAREQYYYARELYYHNRKNEAAKLFENFISDENSRVDDRINACLELSRCRDDTDRSLSDLFKSFLFDSPRAEICCEIGLLKMKQEKYREAVFWYKAAADTDISEHGGGFVNADCYGYIPYMQLCVCFDRLGDRKKAAGFNELAGKIKPYDKSYLYNREYFRAIENN